MSMYGTRLIVAATAAEPRAALGEFVAELIGVGLSAVNPSTGVVHGRSDRPDGAADEQFESLAAFERLAAGEAEGVHLDLWEETGQTSA